MNVNTIREAMQAQPFRPFTLFLADGRSFYVPHADFIAVAPTDWDVTVYSQSETWKTSVDPRLIVSLETVASGQGSSNAG